MNKSVVIIISVLLGCSLNITSQRTTLSLQECRDHALEFNKSLKIAAQDKVVAESQKKEAFTGYLPKINASGSALYFPTLEDISMPGGYLPTGPEAGAPSSNAYSPGMSLATEDLSILSGGVTAQQAIYAGGQVRLGNKMAKKGMEISEQAYQLEEAEVILNTDQAYWNLVLMREKVKLAGKYVQMLDTLEQQLKDSYELGLVPKSEKLKVTVKKNEAQLNLIRSKNGYRIMMMNLCQVIGLPLSTEVRIADFEHENPKLPDLANSAEQALVNRQELKILEGKSQISAYQKQMVNAEFLPQLGAQVAFQQFKIGDLYNDASVTVGASLSVPVFHWGEKKHKKSAAQARIEQADLSLYNTQELVQLEVQQVIIKLQEGYEYILLSQKNKQEAEESLEETKVSFAFGLNTTTDLLNAQAAWQSAVTQEVDALTKFEVLKTTYQKVIGLL